MASKIECCFVTPRLYHNSCLFVCMNIFVYGGGDCFSSLLYELVGFIFVSVFVCACVMFLTTSPYIDCFVLYSVELLLVVLLLLLFFL